MNRHRTIACASDGDPDAWHRIPDEARRTASRRIAELRDQLDRRRAGVAQLDLESATDALKDEG
jgi:hypothetical protein